MASIARVVLPAVLLVGTEASNNLFAADADPFLGQVVSTRPSVRDDIKAALRNASLDLGAEGDDLENLLIRMEQRLRPTYDVLPKNKFGRLGSVGTRYLLHRYFLHQHAWLVKGLAPEEPFPMETVTSWAPADLQVVVGDHLNGRGLTLREAAVLSTMLENQVHAEAVERLRALWRAHDLEASDKIDSEKMQDIIEDHMWTYLTGLKEDEIKKLTLSSLRRARLEIIYPGWSRTRQFVSDTHVDVTKGAIDGLDFRVAEQIVMRVIQRVGAWQDEECQVLKQDMVKLESMKAGRVDLRLFHASAGTTNYIETDAYLRTLGVLDGSDAANPSVVIPNYINSPANFIASGRFFAVACIHTCEDILGHIERSVGGPTASMEALVAVVRGLSLQGSSERATISDGLVSHLEEVASLHEGRVPLHSRLFALWLHHVYPRDCPYPSIAGTTKQILPFDYEEQTGLSWTETPEALSNMALEYKHHHEVTAAQPSEPRPLPWDLHEELLEEEPATSVPTRIIVTAVLIPVLLLFSLIIAMLRPRLSARNVDPNRLLNCEAAPDAQPAASQTPEAAS